MIKNIITLAITIVLIMSCSLPQGSSHKLFIKGSDTMLNLTEIMAEDFMKVKDNISIYVDGGGTRSGVQALANGECQICIASRDLTSSEIKLLADKYQSLGMSFLIAKDALSIYINKSNLVNDFTVDELNDIFTGKITNWKELGGANKKITLVLRNPNSGTYQYFRQHIMKGADYHSDAMIVGTTQNIIDEVSGDEGAIGFGGMTFFDDDVIHASINSVEATIENVRKDKYPISRYLHFYTLNEPRGPVKNFIDWALSPDGQKSVKKAGFISLWEISH